MAQGTYVFRIPAMLSALLLSVTSLAAVAQTPPSQTSPNMPDRTQTIPEKVEPPVQDPRSTAPAQPAESLSERLDKTDGVITPPADLDPEMSVKPPLQERGNMPVIVPPGSAGGDPNVTPK